MENECDAGDVQMPEGEQLRHNEMLVPVPESRSVHVIRLVGSDFNTGLVYYGRVWRVGQIVWSKGNFAVRKGAPGIITFIDMPHQRYFTDDVLRVHFSGHLTTDRMVPTELEALPAAEKEVVPEPIGMSN